MKKLSVRPQTTSMGLPGNSQTTAHAGKPASHKQAHHKLHQLDPHAAQKELLSPRFDAASAARKYLDEPPTTSATALPMAPRKSRSVLGKLANKVGVCLGMARGEPVPSDELLRYQNTPKENGRLASRPRGTWASTGPALTGHLKASEELRHARIAVEKAISMEQLVKLHEERMAGEAALRSTRAANMADKAHDLKGQREALVIWQTALHQRQLAAQQELKATMQRLGQAQDCLAATSSEASSSNDPQNLQRHIEALTAMQQKQAAQHEKLLQRSKDTEAALEQTLRLAQTAGRELFEYESSATDLQSLLPALAKRRKDMEGRLERAQQREQITKSALEKTYGDTIELQLKRLPGFNTAQGTSSATALSGALRIWAEQIDTSLYGAEAVERAAVVTLAIKALADASEGDAAVAQQTLETLRGHTWGTLIAPPGNENRPPLGAATQRTVDLLAHIPRGTQVLGHLLAPATEGMPDHRRRHVARLALQADAAVRAAPRLEFELREWLGAARDTAQAALHAANPAQAIAACTENERAAYHAVRNGYRSNAPGSPYQRANGHLQKIADWLHDIGAKGAQKSGTSKKINPLRSLPQALEVGSAVALPTPRNRAEKELENAASHLMGYLTALRAQRPEGQIPSESELAWQAIAEAVQWTPEGTERASMVLDGKVLDRIHARCKELGQHWAKRPNPPGTETAETSTAPVQVALHAAWDRLRTQPHTAVQAMRLLQRSMLEHHQPGSTPQETTQRTQFHAAMGKALSLLYNGNPDHVNNGGVLFDLLSDMAAHLEWRDRLRLLGQKTHGVNLGPLSAAVSILGTTFGIGIKPTGALQHNEDRLLELYRGRTGMYLQISEQSTNQVQIGAGVNMGYAIPLETEQAAFGVTGSADWRWRGEKSTENGLQLRLPRLTKGREPELDAEFKDLLEHLIGLATPDEDGKPANHDWMKKLLAEHPELSAGLIESAKRSNAGTESNLSASAGFRLGAVGGRGRRAGVAASAGIKARQDNGQTETTVAGYMTTIYRDATAQMKVEMSARANVSVQFAESLKDKPDHGQTQLASASLNPVDASHARELVSKAVTHFCTLFLFDDEIDPMRSDRATDVSEFEVFEQLVRNEWDSWSSYGIGKLGTAVEPGLKHAAAELQLQHFMEQTRAFAKGNGLATIFADKVLKPPVAPALDVYRALARMETEAARLELDKARTHLEADAMQFEALKMDMRTVNSDLKAARASLEAGRMQEGMKHIERAQAHMNRKVAQRSGPPLIAQEMRDKARLTQEQVARCKERAVLRMHDAKAHGTEFDLLVAKDEMWEPTLLLLREKGKEVEERGGDFFIKHQNNRGAEAMRTVAQWILYEPVEHAEPGQRIETAGRWKDMANVPAQEEHLPTLPEDDAEGEIQTHRA